MRTVACYSAGCHVPGKIRVDVVITGFDVVPLLAKIGVVGHRLPLRD